MYVHIHAHVLNWKYLCPSPTWVVFSYVRSFALSFIHSRFLLWMVLRELVGVINSRWCRTSVTALTCLTSCRTRPSPRPRHLHQRRRRFCRRRHASCPRSRWRCRGSAPTTSRGLWSRSGSWSSPANKFRNWWIKLDKIQNKFLVMTLVALWSPT